jgi:hypothetical protein
VAPEPVDIPSRLSAEAAEARIVSGLTTRRHLLGGQWGGPDGRVVLGGVSRERLRLTARPGSLRNSWAPTFRGRLFPVGAGCRLVGRIGWHPFTRVFTAVWLTLPGLILIGATGTAGWRDADFFRAWLAERLQAPGGVANVGP